MATKKGGGVLKNGAKDALEKMTHEDDAPPLRLFSLKHEFQTEWYRFLNPLDPAATSHSLLLDLTRERFPFHVRTKALTLEAMTLFLKMGEDFVYDERNGLGFHPGPEDQKQSGSANFATVGSPIKDLPFARADLTSLEIPAKLVLEVPGKDLPNPDGATPRTWWQSVKTGGANRARLKPSAIADIWIVCRYSVAAKRH